MAGKKKAFKAGGVRTWPSRRTSHPVSTHQELIDLCRNYAIEDGVSVSKWIEIAINERIDRREKKR